jgi:hypothetical protein
MNRLRKYSGGGGLGFNNASLNYSSPSSTGWQSPTLNYTGLQTPQLSTAPTVSSSSKTGFNANQALGYGTAAIGAITTGLGAGMQAQAQIDAINKANRMGREQNVATAKYRAANMSPRSGNTYGTYQYGGSVMGYGEDLDTEATERAGQREITEGVTEGVTSAIPVVGPIIAAGTGMVKGIQTAAGKEGRYTLESGKTIDAYSDSTGAAVGNISKMMTPHQYGFDHAENEEYGMAFFNWALPGIGSTVSAIMANADQQTYEDEMARAGKGSSINRGGTSGLDGQEYRKGVNMNALQDQMERQIPTAKYGGAMDMMDYGKGGLYANIHAKRERIKAGSGETMRSPGDSGAPTAQAFKDSAETAKMGMGGMMEYGKGGYTVTRSDDRKGKTHKVTGPDGSVKYFGDPNMGERSESKHGKEAFYARHKSNLEGNPHFRAYARATWKDGGAYTDSDNVMYKGGGMHYSDGVQMKNANAELEGDEIIMKNGGKKDVKVNGPSHEQGGVPMKLKKGDYVWSDHLKDPQSGMSMAQLYEKLSKNGASESEINQLMQYQEALAGRAGGQGMDQTAKNGGLMKYQNGTPSLSPFIRDPNKTPGEIEAYNKLREQKRAAQGLVPQSQVTAAKKAATIPLSIYKYAGEDFPVTTDFNNTGGPLAVSESAQETPYVPGFKEAWVQRMVGGDGMLSGDPAVREKAFKEGAQNAGKSAAVGKSNTASDPEAKPDYLKYAPEMISGLGSLAGIIATATQDFDKVPVPQADRVKAEKMFLDRISPDAEIARSQQDFRAMLDATLRGGQGPGASSTAQEAYSAKVRADEQARANADRLNIQVDATEKAGNIDSRLKADMFNEENAARYREMAFAQDAASKTFERERTQAIVNQILRGTQGVADTAMNRRYAESISGESGVLERDQKKNLKAFFTSMGLEVPDFLT